MKKNKKVKYFPFLLSLLLLLCGCGSKQETAIVSTTIDPYIQEEIGTGESLPLMSEDQNELPDQITDPVDILGVWNLYRDGIPIEDGYWRDVVISQLVLNEDGTVAAALGFAQGEWYFGYVGTWSIVPDGNHTFILDIDVSGGALMDDGEGEDTSYQIRLKALLNDNCLIFEKLDGDDISIYYNEVYERNLSYADWETRQGPVENYITYETLLKQYPDSAEYTLYDIDNDGNEELIIREYEKHYIYTYHGSTVQRCTDSYGYGNYYWNYWTDCLYAYDGNGLIVHDGGFGQYHLEYVYLYSLENGCMEIAGTLIDTEMHSSDELYAYLEKCTPIDNFVSVTDLSLLYALD